MLALLFCCFQEKTTSEVVDTAEDTETTEEIDDLSWVDPNSLPAGERPCREPVRLKVTYVADGDTFFADGDDGEEKIRIIGVDTPEMQDDECYAQEAKNFLNGMIGSRWVWLTFDEDCTDVYDRTLAYVHVGTGEMDFVERQLLRGGYARSFPFSGTDTFQALFAADEAEAEASNKGGWDACEW